MIADIGIVVIPARTLIPNPDADTLDLFSPISNNTINLTCSLNFGGLAKIKVGWQQF
jgi:hypothetical protein